MRVLVAIRHRVAAWTIPPGHVDRLRRLFPDVTFIHSLDRESDVALADGVDVVFALGFGREALARAARLRWLHGSAHAVGHFPLADLAARRVVVTNSRGVQSTPIAEHVMACVLALARRLPAIERCRIRRAWLPDALTGGESPWLLAGRTMGVIGLGSIGRAVALRASAFGMRTIGVRRRPELGAPPGIDTVLGREHLGRLLAMSDVVVLAAPWTAETDALLDESAIAAMKPGAVVVNVARGQLVDERALAGALSDGRLGGAALDVFVTEPLPPESPFWSLPNVIVTPHTAGFREDHFDAVVDVFADNLGRFLRGDPLLNVVDLDAGY